CQHGYGTPPSF
nr:immunoglobulin light chain junction region [Macaca mulatta]